MESRVAKALVEPPPCTERFQTSDVDQAQEAMLRNYYPLLLEPLEHAFSLDMQVVSAGAFTLGRLRYGADVRKDCGELGNAFHINVPLDGEVLSSCGHQQVAATPSMAAVFNPRGRTVLDVWRSGTTQLCLKIERKRLEDEVARFIGQPLKRPLQFVLPMDLASAHGQRWLHALRLLSDELDHPGGPISHPLLATEVERLIIGALIWGQPHSYSEQMRQPGEILRPRHVHLAMQAVDAHPEAAWTAGALAEVAGVGLRSLEDGFRRHLGMTPLQYLRAVRLDRADEDLCGATPETTVTDVAFRWGFSHLGRFTEAYRQRFGRRPSETLRRSPSARGDSRS
jgi:AraC-like DNA-binding protein